MKQVGDVLPCRMRANKIVTSGTWDTIEKLITSPMSQHYYSVQTGTTCKTRDKISHITGQVWGNLRNHANTSRSYIYTTESISLRLENNHFRGPCQEQSKRLTTTDLESRNSLYYGKTQPAHRASVTLSVCSCFSSPNISFIGWSTGRGMRRVSKRLITGDHRGAWFVYESTMGPSRKRGLLLNIYHSSLLNVVERFLSRTAVRDTCSIEYALRHSWTTSRWRHLTWLFNATCVTCPFQFQVSMFHAQEYSQIISEKNVQKPRRREKSALLWRV